MAIYLDVKDIPNNPSEDLADGQFILVKNGSTVTWKPAQKIKVYNPQGSITETDPVFTSSFDQQTDSTAGIKNNFSVTKRLVRFTVGGVVLTGINLQVGQARDIVIMNDTGQDLNLQHLSTSSSAANRINITGIGLTAGTNVPLSTGCSVRLNYVNNQWRTTNWFGDGYHPNLRGGAGQRVIEVSPNGKETATDTMEFEYFHPEIVVEQNDTALNTLHPGVSRGTWVYCDNIVGGGIAYKKVDDATNKWIGLPMLDR